MLNTCNSCLINRKSDLYRIIGLCHSCGEITNMEPEEVVALGDPSAVELWQEYNSRPPPRHPGRPGVTSGRPPHIPGTP